jgi:hypothetical protein
MAQFGTGLIAGIRQAARQVKGVSRRNLFAWACRTFAGGSPRVAETIFGWNRRAVARGLSESAVALPEGVVPVVEKKTLLVRQADLASKSLCRNYSQ